MPDTPTVLILTSKTGGGHVSLAEALRDRLVPDYAIEIIDPQPHFFHWHYRLVSRYALWLWSAEFRATDTPRQALFAHRVFTRLVSKQLHTLLDHIQPVLVITTYPFLSYEVVRVLEKYLSPPPLVLLFSDANGVHASWLTERNAAATLATTRETYAQALGVGFPAERLHLVGWPVRGQFYRNDGPTRAETLVKLQLDPECFTIFLQGGGEGAAKFGSTVENVLSASPDLQVILATGTNAALLTRFSGIQNLHPLPFTKDIAQYMAAADVIMGKAGPNMLFESVTLGKPFIASSYIPGQEEANLEFVRRHGLGWVVLEPSQQRALVAKLATSPALLDEMTATVQTYRKWNASANEEIVPLIHSLSKNPTRTP